MADRTAAATFAAVFDMLAAIKRGDPFDVDEFARQIVEMTGEYDFRPYQMGCDEALIALGLARRDGDDIVYWNEDR